MNYVFWLTLIFAGGLIYYTYKKKQQMLEDIDDQLRWLQRTGASVEFLYVDANIIKFLFSVKIYRDVNKKNYDDLISMCNDFLEIIYHCETHKNAVFADNIDKLRDLKRNILNKMHSTIYSSSIISAAEIDTAIDSLRFLLNLNIEKIRRGYNENQNILLDTRYKFVDPVEIEPVQAKNLSPFRIHYFL